ncbi:MAG: CCA tRNA nucleotidyltransferase [Acidobacteria bacterium]|nr:CCA tRNA nucleotidyltransferase [Acidobacteriota bacterium]
MALEAGREMARRIVERLQGAGHVAYWVGGCVRDQLMGLEPKDFDVATSARPEQVLSLFPRAQLVGASFGVVLHEAGVEIATFRSEGKYRDGRRPEEVRYETEAALDATRRDFTINAIFHDPIRNETIDFVGGRADLAAGVLRAIGDPHLRFNEDHLRLLRAVRFAARFGYAIETQTHSAMVEMAPLILKIAGERLHDEMRRILTGPNLDLAWKHLSETGLLREMLPEAKAGNRLTRLRGSVSVPLAWAALLEEVDDASPVYRRFRFSDEERHACADLLANEHQFRLLQQLPLSSLKRFLRRTHIADHLELHRATYGETEAYRFASQKLQDWGPEVLSPQPLIDGRDLIALGLAPGPRFSQILRQVEDAQLEGRIQSKTEALRLAVS